MPSVLQSRIQGLPWKVCEMIPKQSICWCVCLISLWNLFWSIVRIVQSSSKRSRSFCISTMTVSAVELAGSQVQSELLRGKMTLIDIGEGTVQRGEEMAHHRAETSQDLTALLAMEGGEGDGSYAKNSRPQANGLKFVEPILEEVISSRKWPKKKLVKIADLGCSSGANSIQHMNFVVSLIKARYKFEDIIPEFQVFFVDLLSNDFNCLFRLITQARKAQGSRRGTAVDYFWTGVPGSFYGRLHPRASLDVVFSSFSLHWLSKIPDAVQQADSPAYNDGHVWIHNGKRPVADAYAEQAKEDLREFLTARADEMVSGGLVFLLMKGRKNEDPTIQYHPNGTTMFGRHMEEVFEELISEKHLDKEVRDSFNLPIYYRTVDEIREAVEEVNQFEINRVELLDDVPGNAVTPEELRASPDACGRRVAMMCRSLLGVLVESHMGEEVANKFFDGLKDRAVKRSEDEAREETVVLSHVNLVILVRR